MKLEQIAGAEIVHHVDDGGLISSFAGKVTAKIDGELHNISLPLSPFYRLLSISRLWRRFLRLDKCNVVLTGDRRSIVIVYRSCVYHYCFKYRQLRTRMRLRNCRNVLHMGVASILEQTIILGEYGSNKPRRSVPIWRSINGGVDWKIVYEFPAGSIRHIHGLYYDKFSDSLWAPTGDENGECYIYQFDKDFALPPSRFGDGTQVWRTVSLFFTKEELVWIMDSPRDTPYLLKMNRETGGLKTGRAFPGPVWYIKEFMDGCYFAQTTKEQGGASITDSVHLYVSRDLDDWSEVAEFQHDGLPLGTFKNAVMSFATGNECSDRFAVSFEAVKGHDGKSYFLSPWGLPKSRQMKLRQVFDSDEQSLPPAPRTISKFPDQLYQTIAHCIGSGDQLASSVEDLCTIWLQKIRRFAEVNRHQLRSVAAHRFGGGAEAFEATLRMSFLMAYAAVQTQDMTYLNAALNLRAAAKQLQGNSQALSDVNADLEQAIEISLNFVRFECESNNS